jgi:hypothetical protein
MIPYFRVFVKAFSLIFYKNKGAFCRRLQRNHLVWGAGEKEKFFCTDRKQEICAGCRKGREEGTFSAESVDKTEGLY